MGTALAMSTEVAVEVGDHSDVGPPVLMVSGQPVTCTVKKD